MRVATYQGESSVAALARRLFRIEGANSAARTAAAETALLAANPRLRDLSKMPAGALLVLPELPYVPVDDGHPEIDAVAAEMLQELRRALEEAGAVLTAGADQQAAEAKRTIGLLRTAAIKRLADKDAVVRDRLTAIRADATARIADAEDFHASQAEALAALAGDLDELARRFPGTKGGSPPSARRRRGASPPKRASSGPDRQPRPARPRRRSP